VSELDGYDDLKAEDKDKLSKAWEDGHVADEDIPESAKKPVGEDGEVEKPQRKKAAAKTDGEGGEKPKKARATKAKKADDDDEGDDDEEKPKKKAPTRKPRAKVRRCLLSIRLKQS